MEIARLIKHPYARPAVLYAAWVALFFVMFFKSWVSEDAYITFRVIDNFIHGYGLRWNVYERVQIYTHPLWLLLQIPFAFFIKNLFALNIALSLLCSSAAVAVVLLTFRKSLAVTLVFFMLPLFTSKTFVEYATSGLETSLSYLLFALLGYVLVHWQKHRFFPLAVSLLSSLLLLNRLDHSMLILPLLVTIAARRDLPRNIGQAMLGSLPLVMWFVFSLWYYGFLFPNTKYAKLDTGFPLADYLEQGAHYYFIWLTQDLASVITVITALALSLRGPNKRQSVRFALAIGILLNLAYVLYIGGDYMMGRFFAFIFFVASWLLLACIDTNIRRDRLFAFALALITAFGVCSFVRDIRKDCDSCIPVVGRVIDARIIFWRNSLFTDIWPPKIRTEGQYKFGRDGRELAHETPPPVKSLRYVGMVGYYAGPQVAIIDELALGDALLARLPAQTGRPFYVGHYQRDLPKGYLEAVRYDTLDPLDSNLAHYYEKLKLITQGNLWSKERLMTIIRFNLGFYDSYKNQYLHPSPAP